MVMTPEQAAEVLRRHKQCHFNPEDLTAALETAIECMSKKQEQSEFDITELLTKYRHVKPNKFGENHMERQYPVSAVIDMINEVRSTHPATPTPTDEQIGEVFEECVDTNSMPDSAGCYVLAMTRTAAIRFARELLKIK